MVIIIIIMLFILLIAIVIIIIVLTQVRRHCVLNSGSQHGHFLYGLALSSPCFHYGISSGRHQGNHRYGITFWNAFIKIIIIMVVIIFQAWPS